MPNQLIELPITSFSYAGLHKKEVLRQDRVDSTTEHESIHTYIFIVPKKPYKIWYSMVNAHLFSTKTIIYLIKVFLCVWNRVVILLVSLYTMG